LLVGQLLQDASPVSLNFPGEQSTQVPSDDFIFPEAHAEEVFCFAWNAQVLVAAVQNKPVTPVQVFTPVLEVELPQVQSAEFADNPSVCAHPGVVVELVVVVPFSTQCSSEALARCKQPCIPQY
jgi:hypothetical protein